MTQWAFRRAFALNPDLPLAHNHFTQIEADSGQALQALVRLIGQAEKYPNNPELFIGIVQATRYCGLLDVSLRAHERARRLDAKAVTSVAHTYFLLGDYERTIEWYPPGQRYYLDAAALAAAGREASAAELLCERSYLMPLIDSLRACLAGNTTRCLEVIKRALERRPAPEPEIQFYLARHLARAGAQTDALALLDRVATGGFYSSIALQNDPWLKPLATEYSYSAVLQAVLRREADARRAFEVAGGNRVLPGL